MKVSNLPDNVLETRPPRGCILRKSGALRLSYMLYSATSIFEHGWRRANDLRMVPRRRIELRSVGLQPSAIPDDQRGKHYLHI